MEKHLFHKTMKIITPDFPDFTSKCYKTNIKKETMRTNHINKLDPALIRPGRVDMIRLLDAASAQQIAAITFFFCSLYQE